MPDITDKWKVIYFIDQVNNISCSILGDLIDFHILNPNEILDKNNKSIKYKVNMYNKTTKLIINRFSFYFKYDIVEMGPILYINPYSVLTPPGGVLEFIKIIQFINIFLF